MQSELGRQASLPTCQPSMADLARSCCDVPRPTPLKESATRPTAAVPTPELLLPDTLPHAGVLRFACIFSSAWPWRCTASCQRLPSFSLLLLLAEIVAEDGPPRAATH
eukprot:COSAG01_NODE_42984_length_434_cov_1.235821_1_plen_107_part_01